MKNHLHITITQRKYENPFRRAAGPSSFHRICVVATGVTNYNANWAAGLAKAGTPLINRPHMNGLAQLFLAESYLSPWGNLST